MHAAPQDETVPIQWHKALIGFLPYTVQALSQILMRVRPGSRALPWVQQTFALSLTDETAGLYSEPTVYD